MTPAAAAKAYSTLGNQPMKPEAKASNAGGGFADMLQSAMRDVEQSGKVADQVSLKAAAGQGDLVNVVTSVSESELNVQTVVTLRDKVIEAYQEIMRMPI